MKHAKALSMNILSDSVEISLAPHGLFEVADPAGRRIECSRGTVWLTLDGDTRDVILEAGESFFTTEHRRALVYALGAASLQVSECATQREAQGSLRRRLANSSSDCSRSALVWPATRAAISG